MVRSSHEGGGAMNNIKTKKSKIRGLWYMHLMLLVFWPLSILEYIRISKENKRMGLESADYVLDSSAMCDPYYDSNLDFCVFVF